MLPYLNFTFLTFILLLNLQVLPALAQRKVSFGPMLGSNLSSFYGKNAGNSTWKAGILAGGFITYSRQQHNGITAEVYLIQKGERNRFADSSDVQAINYIEIPVLFKYFISSSPNIRPVLFGGPAMSYRLNAIRYDKRNKVNNSKHITSSDLGFMFGAGSNFKVYGRWLNLDLRYTFGITEVYTATSPRSGRISNHTISSTISMGFGTGKK